MRLVLDVELEAVREALLAALQLNLGLVKDDDEVDDGGDGGDHGDKKVPAAVAAHSSVAFGSPAPTPLNQQVDHHAGSLDRVSSKSTPRISQAVTSSTPVWKRRSKSVDR